MISCINMTAIQNLPFFLREDTRTFSAKTWKQHAFKLSLPSHGLRLKSTLSWKRTSSKISTTKCFFKIAWLDFNPKNTDVFTCSSGTQTRRSLARGRFTTSICTRWGILIAVLRRGSGTGRKKAGKSTLCWRSSRQNSQSTWSTWFMSTSNRSEWSIQIRGVKSG